MSDPLTLIYFNIQGKTWFLAFESEDLETLEKLETLVAYSIRQKFGFSGKFSTEVFWSNLPPAFVNLEDPQSLVCKLDDDDKHSLLRLFTARGGKDVIRVIRY